MPESDCGKIPEVGRKKDEEKKIKGIANRS